MQPVGQPPGVEFVCLRAQSAEVVAVNEGLTAVENRGLTDQRGAVGLAEYHVPRPQFVAGRGQGGWHTPDQVEIEHPVRAYVVHAELRDAALYVLLAGCEA